VSGVVEHHPAGRPACSVSRRMPKARAVATAGFVGSRTTSFPRVARPGKDKPPLRPTACEGNRSGCPAASGAHGIPGRRL
jgi:hypothetical protein